MISDGTDKMNGAVLLAVVAFDVDIYKSLKTFFKQRNDLWHFLMTTQEGHKGRQENIRILFLINPVNDIVLAKIKRGLKIFFYCGVQLVIQMHGQQLLAKPRTTRLIS